MPAFYLVLLGGFQATYADRPVTGFPTNKIRALLAYLAINADQAHPRTQLATLLWGDWEDREALANLRKSLFRLRKTLNQFTPGLGEEVLHITRSTVQWRGQDSTVDVLTFRSLLAQVAAHSHRAMDSCLLCLDQLTHAVNLYNGELLAGIAENDAIEFVEWLAGQRQLLHREAMGALSTLASVYWSQQAFAPLQRTAAHQLRLEPWHEPAHRYLMQVYAAQGRRAEALAQYARCREILAEHLGIDPSAETEELFTSMRASPLVTRPAGSPPPAPEEAWLHHFPTQTTPFIGRENAIRTIQARLQDPDCRLLTLVGAGGVGKTRLAVETMLRFPAGADIFPDGCYFIPLATANTSDRLVAIIGEQLALPIGEGTLLEQQVLTALQERMVLIILDNYEQLLPDTRFVAALLRSAPSVKLLITSRIPLNLQAEWRWPLAGLEVPGPKLSLDQVTSSTAVQLFQSSAQRLLPDFQIDEAGMGPVSDICRHLAGLPLAIEIAASWLRLHPLPVLAAKIQEGFAFLTTHARDLPERHRSLRLVFDHSWQLLGETERTAFARLTCFQGSFDLEAALQVTETSIMTLLTLLDHTLLQRLPHDRYGLHPVLHHFARSYLEAQEALFNRHAAYYLNLVAHAAPQFATQAAGEAVTLIANDLDNIHQAWQWAVQQQQVALLRRSLDGLLSFYQFRGFYQEGRELFAAAAAALAGRPEEQSLVNRLFLAQAACWRKLGEVDMAIQLAERVVATNDPATLTAAIIALGQLHELRGDFSEALHYLEQAQSFLADQGAPNDRAEVFNRLGKVYRNLTRFDASIAALNQALSINQDIGNDAGAAENHANLGLNYKDTGSYPEAIFHIQQAIALSEKLNHRENIARFTQNLGLVYWQMDALDQALACYRAALVIAEELQSKRGIAMCRGGIAVILRRQHHYEESLDHYQQALRLAEALPDKAMQATLLGNIGNLYKEIGQFDRALTYQEQALAIDRTLGSSGNVARHLGNIGDIHKEQGHFATAIPFYEEAIPHFREIDARYYLCWSLVSYGETLFALGRLAEAAQAQEEGERIAIELDRQLYIFLSRLLSARIAAQRGNIMQASRQLTNLARTFDALEYRAEIAYARWEMQPNEATRQEAGRLFSKLAEETGIFRHRQRAQVLREATT